MSSSTPNLWIAAMVSPPPARENAFDAAILDVAEQILVGRIGLQHRAFVGMRMVDQQIGAVFGRQPVLGVGAREVAHVADHLLCQIVDPLGKRRVIGEGGREIRDFAFDQAGQGLAVVRQGLRLRAGPQLSRLALELVAGRAEVNR